MINYGFKQIEENEYTKQYKNKQIIKGVVVFKDKKDGKEISCKIIKE
jgi:hypothetical protein